MTKQVSTHALAARAIRKELKANKIDASVTSQVFSGGASIEILMYDYPPDTVALVEQIVKKYQRGHFSHMSDMYENTNVRVDIPQVTYTNVTNKFSSDMWQRAYRYMLKNAFVSDLQYLPSPENACSSNTSGTWIRVGDDTGYASTLVHRILHGNLLSFWTTLNA